MSAPVTRRESGAVSTAPGTVLRGHTRHGAEERWHDRPVLAVILRLAVVAAPFAASVTAAWLMAGFLATPEGIGERVLWWAGVLSASLGALLVFDRAARRLLPLAALLELSLIFPDRAPSRFSVALRSGSTKRLQAREVEALRRGDQEPADAARTILALAASLGVHDRDTRGHSERVRAYADLIGAELGLDPDDRDRLRWAALLHDLGKVTVPAHTLNADGALTNEDWEALRRHPLEGARLAEPLRDWLGEWALAIEQHHERFDGTGYPYGLKGEELSLAARIVAVADSYDAMTSARSYMPPISAASARQELAAQAGTHFDPVVVRAFLSISLGRLRWVMGPLAFLAIAPFVPVLGGVRRALETGGRAATLGATSMAATASVLHPAATPDAPVPEPRRPVPVAAAPAPAEPSLPGAIVPAAAGPTSTPVEAPPAETPAAEAPPVEVRPIDAPPVPTAAVTGGPPPSTPASTVPTTTAAPTTTPTTTATTSTTTTTTTTTTVAPSAAMACREPANLHSSRPCLPPRWGHTDEGNPRRPND